MMTELFLLQEFQNFLIFAWFLFSLWGLYVNTYRSLIDRVRAGVLPPPKNEGSEKLLNTLLAAPNHERPFHVESAFLSSMQITLGTLALYISLRESLLHISFHLSFIFFLAFLSAFLFERIWSRIASYSVVASKFLPFHLKIGKPFMLGVQIICLPFSALLRQLEKGLQSISDTKINLKDDKNGLADHIRTLSRESSTLDPEVFEIVGNTIEMGHLHVRDVLVPRNQVQVLDCEDSIDVNLKILRDCGHTRIPICEGDLDHCIGIIHVKYAFRLLSDGKSIDLRVLSKNPAILSTEDPLPVALRKMMKWKVHMALVQDEFGGVDGVITLEDILEEVVGEIQDEFDSEEDTVKKSGRNKWKISGLSPVHELPSEIEVDSDEELTSFGGLITKELGRIPESGEGFEFKNMFIRILKADETRVHAAEVSILPKKKEKEE